MAFRIMIVMVFLFMLLTPAGKSYSENSSLKAPAGKTASYESSADSKKNLIILNKKNGYTDQFEAGSFSRGGGSGPGTGPFIGKGFEFAKGNCADLDPKWLKKHGWKSDTLGCGSMLLSSDWCARLKSDADKRFTLHFLSWTQGPSGKGQRCMGDCERNENQTAYIRTKSW